MKTDIIQFVKTCPTCQKREGRRGTAPLEPIRKGTTPFHQVGMDIMGPLPITLTGKRYIVVAVDHFTKWVEARALEEKDALSVASFFYDDVICRHGVPNILSTDRGTEFINEFMDILTRKFHIRHIKTTAYHPQGNGQVERTNRTIKDILAKITPRSGDWSHYLQSALFAIRVSQQASTRFTPAELLTGRKFRLPFDNRDQPITIIDPEDYAIQELARLQEIRTEAGNFIIKAQSRQKKEHDKKILTEPLKIGDPVLLYRETVETSWSAKMEPKWEGPYYVQSIKGLTYRLRRLKGTILPSTYHRDRLKFYHGRLPKPIPVVAVPARKRPAELLARDAPSNSTSAPPPLLRTREREVPPNGSEEIPQPSPRVLLHPGQTLRRNGDEAYQDPGDPSNCQVLMGVLQGLTNCHSTA
jgi:Integrase core domain